MGAAEWREADDLCSPLLPPTALDSLNVAPTPPPVAFLSLLGLCLKTIGDFLDQKISVL